MVKKKKGGNYFITLLITFYIDGHYLNLPVLDEDRNIVGLIDVLRLTYATLEQVKKKEQNEKRCNIQNRSIASKVIKEMEPSFGTALRP
jgi:CBS-domain-containing membrane protein